MRLISFTASGRSSYGAVVGDGVVDFGRRLGDRCSTLRAAIAYSKLDGAAAEISGAAPDIALSQVTLLPPITNPDKIFFPKAGHTKLDLANYYLAVADGALRGIAGRPIVLDPCSVNHMLPSGPAATP